ncbi:PREDICTED: E3 ubiquitin-protein ligase RNF103-like isoform X2 [Priapulus caudatus]|nr:PREDICTED: E3 ubiquitin-protein ligase RNF103-like isoform X2 [Priapulus caudatus]
MWVVQVVGESLPPLVRNSDWALLEQKLSKFGIRTGTFLCDHDIMLCDNKGWFNSRLVLANPHGDQVKTNVTLHSYSRTSNPDTIFTWISSHLSSRVSTISSLEELERDWLQEKGYQLQVILISHLQQPPIFLSALSVKFPGRVRFGAFTPAVGQRLPDNLGVVGAVKLPAYLVVMHDRILRYGSRPSEFLSYDSMYLYLTTFYPEVNGLFLCSVVLVNTLAVLEAFLLRGKVITHLVSSLWKLGKYNIMLIFLWLPLLAVFQLPRMESVCYSALRFLQLLSSSELACFLRGTTYFYATHPLLAAACFVAVGLVGFIVNSAMGHGSTVEEQEWNWTFPDVPYLFRPVSSSVSRPMRTDIDLEEGIALMIERLANPTFWLQPIVPQDYIRCLPCWSYRQSGRESKCPVHCTVQNERIEWSPISNTVACLGTFKEALIKGILPNLSKYVLQRFSIFKWCQPTENSQQVGIARPVAEVGCAGELPISPSGMDNRILTSQMASLSASEAPNTECSGHSQVNGSERNRDRNLCTTGSDTAGDAGTDCGDSSTENSDSESKMAAGDLRSDAKGDCNCGWSDSGPDDAAPAGVLASVECAICLEPYVRACVLCALPCGHGFHQQCIFAWLSRDNHCCPVCRWPAYKSKPKST